MNKSTSPQFSLPQKLLVLFLLVSFCGQIYSNRSRLTSTFDITAVEQTYLHSQYNLNNAEFYGNIDDDLLFQYAGYKYIGGVDPSTINFETPYLVKYLYGLSIALSGNAYLIQLLFSAAQLFFTYLLAKQILGNTTLALLSSSLLIIDPLFIDQAANTLLDLPHALFIVLAILLFLKYKKSPTIYHLLLTSIFLGAVATTKLFITAGLLLLIFLFLINKTRAHLFSLAFPAALLYLSTFIAFFLSHRSISDFINLHIDLVRFYRSYLPEYPPGELLRIIFLGRWQTWWGQGIIASPVWSVFWPASVLGTLFAFIPSLKSKNTPLLLISSFSILYLISNLFHVIFPRYLLSILPLMYICLLYSIREASIFLNAKLNIKH